MSIYLTSATFLSLTSIGTLSYKTHPQAVYMGRLLDFKNLPKPKNTNDIDDLLETEYLGNYNLP